MYLELFEEDVVHSDQLKKRRCCSSQPNAYLASFCQPQMFIEKYQDLENRTLERSHDSNAHAPREANYGGMWWLRGPPGGGNHLEALKCFREGVFRPVAAVIDTGCLMHPDLEPAYREPEEECHEYDYSDSRKPNNNSYDEPLSHRHGTTVTGLIMGATLNNRYGIAGVCPHCRISCPKTSNGKSMSSAAMHKSISHILGAKAVKIVNPHSYVKGWSDYEKRAFGKLHAAGILTVMSADNRPCNSALPANVGLPNACKNTEKRRYTSGFPQGPSDYKLDNMLVVGGSDRNGMGCKWSTWGSTTVHVFAPGEYVKGLANLQVESSVVTITDGTSFSSPIVAGLAGYLWSFDATVSYTDVEKLIMESVRLVAGLKGRCQSEGLVDAAPALKALGVECKREACPGVRKLVRDQTIDLYGPKSIKEISSTNEGAPLPTGAATPIVPPPSSRPSSAPHPTISTAISKAYWTSPQRLSTTQYLPPRTYRRRPSPMPSSALSRPLSTTNLPSTSTQHSLSSASSGLTWRSPKKKKGPPDKPWRSHEGSRLW